MDWRRGGPRSYAQIYPSPVARTPTMTTPESTHPGDEPSVKRRKLRKGTQSCWECKRRKVRCLFALETNTTCDNCFRRKTACISQEYVNDVEQPEMPRKKKKVVDMETRLSRVEDVLQQLLQRAEPHPKLVRDQAQRQCNNQVRVTKRLFHLFFMTDLIKSLPSGSNETNALPSEANSSSTSGPHPPEPSPVDTYTGLSKDLVKAWPSTDDLTKIYQLPISFSTHSHIHLCTSASARPNNEPITTRQLLQLPPPGCHHVLIARKLLFLGSLLQGAISTPGLSDASRKRFREIMTRAVDAATRLVTTVDALTASVEGVECIMIEALIHNYTGNLHRAWMVVRRAAAVAQAIGLHQGSKMQTSRILDLETKIDFNPDLLPHCRDGSLPISNVGATTIVARDSDSRIRGTGKMRTY
jgi:hypothetical protein